jgi:signal transduction histidine kinase
MAIEPVGLAELVEASVALLRDAARAAELTLTTDLAPECGIVAGDRRRLAQALDHLLRNAVAFTPPGGHVLVRASCVGGQGEIVISDDGPGIPAHQRERIFDRFNRSSIVPDAKNAEPISGGFGLPLARQLIEANGGTLELLSEVGRGTSAIIRLPLAERPC